MNAASSGPGRVVLAVGASLYPEIIAMRQLLELVLDRSTSGFVPPPLVVRRDDRLGARAIRFEAQDRPDSSQLEEGLPAGAKLVRASPLFVQARTGVKAQPWPDPFQPVRLASVVLDMSRTSLDSSFPSLVLGAAEVIAVRMRIWYRRFIAERVDVVTTAQVLAALPAADAAALLRACPIDAVADLLKALLQDGVELADFDRAAPFVADEGRVRWTDKSLVTAAVPGRIVIAAPRPADDAERRHVVARAALVAGTLWRRAGNDALQVWSLDEVDGWVPGAGAPVEETSYFQQALKEQVGVAGEVHGAILVCSPELRKIAADGLRDTCPELMVVARHELPRNIPFRPRGRIRIARDSAQSPERRRA